MPRALVGLILAASVPLSTLSGQAASPPLRVEEASGIATKTSATAESRERLRALIGRGAYASARRLADEARGFRIVISLDDRVLWVLRDNDTIRTTSVGIASGLTLDFGGRSWTFRTPRGKHTVIGSKANPVWTPPDWAYAETASQYNLRLAWLSPGKPVALHDGRSLTIQNGTVGVVDREGQFRTLPRDEHIVFESTLYVPPFGTVNRQIKGQLGPYALDLGGGYLLHGGPQSDSLAPTHGCIRLTDQDLEWLYHNVAKGTPVYIY